MTESVRGDSPAVRIGIHGELIDIDDE